MGSAGANIIRTGAGNDIVDAGGGDDTVEGGAGADALAGGAGTDTLDYTTSNAAVVVVLSLGYAAGGHAEGDVISSFENVAGSAFADVLLGTSGDNILLGLNNNDRLDGGVGNDFLDGGLGSDRMVGGVGNDIFIVGALGDVIDELAGEGSDQVWAAQLLQPPMRMSKCWRPPRTRERQISA